MEWQPIATAPQDGTQVLLLNRNAMDQHGFFLFTMWVGYYDLRDKWKCATHWMPLPLPPKDA